MVEPRPSATDPCQEEQREVAPREIPVRLA
jgi:hypothetical protein